jgi:DNA polymerase III subunit delta'
MSSIDSFTAAFEGLRQGYESGRIAHAYLLVGSPRGDALAFAESFLQMLFCQGKRKPCGTCSECTRVKDRVHPDVLWIEPESRSRKIRIEQIREQLAPRIMQTSYGGGWKAGVLLHADRLTDEAGNAFLKILEEPPGSSILLLVTDAAQHLLPTVVSRCQRIVLSDRRDDTEAEWYKPLLAILQESPSGGAVESIAQAGRLKSILELVKKRVEAEEEERARAEADARQDGTKEEKETFEARVKSRVNEVRTAIMRCILLWRRDVLVTVLKADESVLHYRDHAEAIRTQAAGLTYDRALSQVQAVEGMIRQLEKNMPDETVMLAGLRGLLGASPSGVDSPAIY